MKCIFMGSAEFSIPSLEALCTHHSVQCVVTNPDKPAGRGKIITANPVHAYARHHALPVEQPEKLDEKIIHRLDAIQADVIVVVAYGKLLPPALLTLTPYGAINVHPSLLPKYRGAAPVPWSIIKGEHETGISIQFLTEQLDCGDIIIQEKTPIDPDENSGMLLHRLAFSGADCLLRALTDIEQNTVMRIPQPPGTYFYARKLKPNDGKIVWTENLTSLYNHVRGVSPVPGAWTIIGGKRIKIISVRCEEAMHETDTRGTVVRIEKLKGIGISVPDGILWITELQPPGKSVMTAQSFLNGYRVQVGDRCE